MTENTASKKNIQTAFGRFHRQRREALGLTLQDVAKRLTDAGWKIAHPTVAHWESLTAPTVPQLSNPAFVNILAQVLETTPDVILHESGLLTGVDNVNQDDAAIAALVAALQKMTPESREIVFELVKRIRN